MKENQFYYYSYWRKLRDKTKVKKRKQDVREQGLDVTEGSELGNIDGQGKKKDHMH